MTGTEKAMWKRFFMIYGPVGEQRLDVNFAWLRQIIAACHSTSEEKHSIEDFVLKYDYKGYFNEDDPLAAFLNPEKDFDYLQKRFGK